RSTSRHWRCESRRPTLISEHVLEQEPPRHSEHHVERHQNLHPDNRVAGGAAAEAHRRRLHGRYDERHDHGKGEKREENLTSPRRDRDRGEECRQRRKAEVAESAQTDERHGLSWRDAAEDRRERHDDYLQDAEARGRAEHFGGEDRRGIERRGLEALNAEILYLGGERALRAGRSC